MAGEYLKNANLLNKARRVPMCFCIDTSSSMGIIVDGFENIRKTGKSIFTDQMECTEVEGGITLMNKVHEALKNFYEAILDDDASADSCEVAIITFNDYPIIYEEFSGIDQKSAPEFMPVSNSNTNISSALREALKLIEEQKRIYEENKIAYHIPWLVLFTDGHSTDDVSLIKNELMKLQRENSLYVYTVALTDNEELLNDLKGFSVNEPIKCAEPNEIKSFFDFLSRSVYMAVNGNTKAQDELDF